MVCFGTRERDTAKGKEKLVGRGWRVRGGPARKMAGKMEGSLSIMPGPSASLYASNNSLIDLRKTGHLRAEKTPLSPAFVCPSVSPSPSSTRIARFSFLLSPSRVKGGKKIHALRGRDPDCGFLRCVENWQERRVEETGGWIETGASRTRERGLKSARSRGKAHFLSRWTLSLLDAVGLPLPRSPLNERDESAKNKEKRRAREREREKYSRKVVAGPA